MTISRCPGCTARVADDQRFCTECGTRLTPQPQAADRNAVMRRPGGGQPDPFQLGTSDYDTDDFFAQFTPKRTQGDQGSDADSKTANTANAADASPFPSRRSRRRFVPNIYDTATVVDGSPAQPKPVQQQPEASSPQRAPQTPPDVSVDDESAPTRRVQTVNNSGTARQPHPGQQPPSQTSARTPARPQPQSSPQQPEASKPEPAASPFSPEPVQHAQAPEAETDNRIAAAHEDAPAPGSPAPSSAMPPLPPVGGAANSRQSETPSKPDAQRQPVTNRESAPAPGMQQGTPLDNSFTQLIEGLPNDPADQPIAAPRFDKTGVVPVPSRPAQNSQQQANRDRASAFYAGADNAQRRPAESVTPGETPIDSPFIEDSSQRPARPPQRPSSPAQQQPARPAARPQQEEDDLEALFGFSDDASEPETRALPTSAGANDSFVAGSVTAARAGERRERTWKREPAAASAAAAPSNHGPFQPTPAGGGGSSPFEPRQQSAVVGDGGVAQKRRGVAVILVAAAAALVLILGAVLINGLFGGGEEEAAPPPASTTEEVVTESPENTEETPSPEPTPTPETKFDPVSFASESGNIRCQITQEHGVACQILQRDFQLPQGECKGPNYSGAAVGLAEDGATFPCLQGDLRGGAIPYDQEVKAGPYTCSINFDNGVICQNEKGTRFAMEYSKGIVITGDQSKTPNPDVPPVG